MYVCMCNAISEEEIRAMARECGGGAEDVYLRLGCTPQCAMCLGEADKILAEERESVE
jgi:bacterioferritin-associated ferredoxin